MKISVIIPVLNKWELSRACLESLREHTPDAVAELEVLLVDNASTDATPTEAPKLGAALFGAGFVYLPQPVNRNFSASCNIGARAASGELLFFLNNDTLLTSGWLPPLLQALSLGSAAALGPLLLYPSFAGRKDRVQHLGVVFTPQMHPQHFYEGFPAHHPLSSKSRDLQVITGAALLIKRSLFLDLGAFDEDFINGGEDVEFGLRLRKAGYLSKVEPASIIYHLSSQTPGIRSHAEHNAKVLKEKALSLIMPDMARMGMADGYTFELGSRLHGHFELPARRLELLNGLYERESGEAALLDLLDQEPLWHKGYELLADIQEEDDRLQDAADTLYLSLRFKDNLRLAHRLRELAQKTRHSKYHVFASDIVKWYVPENFSGLRAAAEFMHDFCQRVGMSPEKSAYERWLAKEREYAALYGLSL